MWLISLVSWPYIGLLKVKTYQNIQSHVVTPFDLLCFARCPGYYAPLEDLSSPERPLDEVTVTLFPREFCDLWVLMKRHAYTVYDIVKSSIYVIVVVVVLVVLVVLVLVLVIVVSSSSFLRIGRGGPKAYTQSRSQCCMLVQSVNLKRIKDLSPSPNKKLGMLYWLWWPST